MTATPRRAIVSRIEVEPLRKAFPNEALHFTTWADTGLPGVKFVEKAWDVRGASAPGSQAASQGLKPPNLTGRLWARLKPCPHTNPKGAAQPRRASYRGRDFTSVRPNRHGVFTDSSHAPMRSQPKLEGQTKDVVYRPILAPRAARRSA